MPGIRFFASPQLCRGLYVVVSGQFLRKTERMETRLTLGSVRAGDLVELAAALGDGRHTYTLTAQTPGRCCCCQSRRCIRHFRLIRRCRMQLLEELAREVSRAYNACCADAHGRNPAPWEQGLRRR